MVQPGEGGEAGIYIEQEELTKVVAVAAVDALLALCPKASLGAGRSGAVDS